VGDGDGDGEGLGVGVGLGEVGEDSMLPQAAAASDAANAAARDHARKDWVDLNDMGFS
jgi:hypothetical protein